MTGTLPRPFWRDMTTVDFSSSDTSSWIAVLPICAIEQHGPHLPVSTDTAIAEGLIRRSVELLPNELPVTFLPVVPVGKSNEHIASPGTLTLSWETLGNMLIELGDSVARAGIHKLILANSHGGNVSMINVVARELRVKHDILVVEASWARLGYPEGALTGDENRYGIHGGESETSIMLHLCPELVKMELAEDFRTSQLQFEQRFKHLRGHGGMPFGWKAQDLHPSGAAGDASKATAEKGRATIDHQARAFVELLEDVHSFDWQAHISEGTAT